MLSIFMSIQTEHTDVAHEGGRQFQQQNRNVGTGQGCAPPDSPHCGTALQTHPRSACSRLQSDKPATHRDLCAGRRGGFQCPPGPEGTQECARASSTRARRHCLHAQSAHRECTSRDKGREQRQPVQSARQRAEQGKGTMDWGSTFYNSCCKGSETCLRCHKSAFLVKLLFIAKIQMLFHNVTTTRKW